MPSRNKIEIQITATDDASDSLKSLSSNVKNFGTNVTKIGVGMTAVGAPFAALVASSIQSFKDSQNVTAQLQATLQSTGQAAGISAQQAQDYASAMQAVTRFSDETILSGENLLLTFTNIKGEAFTGATQAALDLSTATGQDLQTSVIQIGKALNDPIAGLSSLTRVGVTFTEQQKEQIKEMVAAGDTMGAQKLVLAELGREFGGSALAAGQTFAGQQDILANRMDNLKEKLGEVAVNALPPLTGALGDALAAFENLPQPMQDMIMKGIVLMAGLVVLGPIVAAVGGAITLFGSAIAFALSPAGLLILAIAGIVVAANSLYPGGITKLFQDATKSAQMLATLGFGALMIASDWAKARLGELLTTILTVISKIDELKNRLTVGVSGLSGIIGGVTSGQFSIGQVIQAVQSEIAGSRDSGGAGRAGSAYMIGKGAQPELFIPSSNGTFIPNADRMGGSGINVQSLIIQASGMAEGAAAGEAFIGVLDEWQSRGNR